MSRPGLGVSILSKPEVTKICLANAAQSRAVQFPVPQSEDYDIGKEYGQRRVY